MKFATCSKENIAPASGKKVAIIGAGPGGLAVAGVLICMGHEVVVYDMLPEPGGLLIFGIPEFRMPKENIRKGIKELKALGVKFICNKKVGVDIDLNDIINEYDAVVIATGAWRERELKVPGADLEGVYSVLDYLVKLALFRDGYVKEEEVPKIGKKVVVIGGGNSAMDGARTAKRTGADVTVVYRRTEEYMPAFKSEVKHAKEEGIKFIFLASPVRILGDEQGRVKAIECIRMQLGEPDSSGRPRPEPIPGSEFTIECDTVITAIGEMPTPPFDMDGAKYGIAVDPKGRIITDDLGRTSREGVFALGDVVTGPSNIGLALSMGKRTAKAVDEYLKTGKWM